MHDVTVTVNGRVYERRIPSRLLLSDFIREELTLLGTHVGCEHGVCGACTVLVDGNPARACIALAVSLEGADIRTLEGLADDPRMIAIKDAFHLEHGFQCGFCTPGMLISTWDLLRRRPNLTDKEIREAMSGNLCRCTGYQGITRSISRAADTLRAAAAA